LSSVPYNNKMFLKTLLILSFISCAMAGDVETLEKIRSLRTFIKEKHAKDFNKVIVWSKSGFKKPIPKIDPKLVKTFSYLEKLNADYLKEHDFSEPSEKEKIHQNYLWYKLVNKELWDPTSTTEPAEAARYKKRAFYGTINYLRYSEAVNLTSSTASSELNKTFTGFSAGGGWVMNAKWRFQGELFANHGDLQSSSPSYTQTNAVSKGIILTPYYTHKLSNTVDAFLGLPLMYRSLTVKDDATVKAELKTAFLLGPEAAINFTAARHGFLQGSLSYLQGQPAFKFGLGYFFY
jgi:hypothetical protein